MTLKHKIKLIWCRFNWWLKTTDEAKKHYIALVNYQFLRALYKKLYSEYLTEQKKKAISEETKVLKIKVELLATILDIKP